ncbi:MAG: sensor histidine kinase YesM [Spirosomataceae bacterium]|jgi:sensor histidine kinase YesM
MVSLARKKSDLLEPMLIKMSEILRYMLYEKDDSKIPIEKEYAYLNNYIDLQILRFGKKVKVNFESNLENTSLLIEPMLLIPFVENAFKHGTGIIKEPTIDIILETNADGIFFQVKNITSSAQQIDTKDPSSGIGLVNVKRRLDLLYQKRNKLKIVDSANSYQVSLNIYFHD